MTISDYLTIYLQPAQEPTLEAAELAALEALAARPDSQGRLPTAEDWTPTYDYAWAVAEGWKIKAAKVAGNYAFSDEGQSFQRDQVYQHCIQQEQAWRARCVSCSVIASSLTDQYDQINAEDLDV